MAVGKVISAVLVVSVVVGVVVIGSHQVSVRSVASDLGRRLRSVSGRRLDVPPDMVAPLKLFEGKVGPVIADWTCGQWVQIYGDTVAAQGCPNSVVRASDSCDQGCQDALTSDPEFIRRRCPQTCNVAEHPSDTAAQQLPEGFGESLAADMTAPLGMFADTIPAEVAAWTCGQWLAIYGADATTAGCTASAIMGTDACDDGCQGAFTADPEFARRRCPQTCNVQFPAKSLAVDVAGTGDAMMGHLGDRDAEMKQLAMEVQALQQQINDAASSGNMDLLSQLTTALAEKQEDLKSLAVIS